MLIYIAGAGGMGCRFGYQLSQTDHEVILLDHWEDHIATIKSEGLKVSGDKEDLVKLTIMKPQEAEQTADVIILLTKADQLPKMLQDIRPIIGPKTKVLSLLNGLGHATTMRRYIPDESIMIGTTIWTAGLKGPGKVHLTGEGSLSIQNLVGDGSSASQLLEALNAAGLQATYDNEVIKAIWRKACINGTMNPTCAVLDCTIGELFSTQAGLDLVKGILDEFIAVAASEGVVLEGEELWSYVMEASKKYAPHFPSMHQDLIQNQRRTEIDYLNGAVVFKGKRAGIPTPNCQMMTDMIHIKESLLGLR